MRYRLVLDVLLEVRFFGLVVCAVDFFVVDFTVLLPVLAVDDLLTVFAGVLLEADDDLVTGVLLDTDDVLADPVFVGAIASMRG